MTKDYEKYSEWLQDKTIAISRIQDEIETVKNCTQINMHSEESSICIKSDNVIKRHDISVQEFKKSMINTYKTLIKFVESEIYSKRISDFAEGEDAEW